MTLKGVQEVLVPLERIKIYARIENEKTCLFLKNKEFFLVLFCTSVNLISSAFKNMWFCYGQRKGALFGSHRALLSGIFLHLIVV